MNTLYLWLSRIAYYTFTNRKTLYSQVKEYINDPETDIDGKINMSEVTAAIRLIKKSGATLESFDDNMVTWAVISGVIKENTSKKLRENTQWPVDCVPRSMIRCINYNTDVSISAQREQAYIDDLYKKKIIWPTGSLFSDIQKYLRDVVKRDYGVDLLYFREQYGSSKYNELISKGYSHAMWGWLSSKYISDFVHDGVININNYNWREKIDYYHAFLFLPEMYTGEHGGTGNIVENYKRVYKRNNVYTNAQVKTFANKGVFFGYGYFFLDTKKTEVVQEELQKQKQELKVKDLKKSDYQKYLDRGFIENPNPERVLTEKLYGTLRERELRELSKF